MNITTNPTRTDWTELTTRPAKVAADLSKIISEVFDDVALKGDKALFSYTEKFDKVVLNEATPMEQLMVEAPGDLII